MNEHLQPENSLQWFAPAVLLEVTLSGVIRAHNATMPYWLGVSPQRESDVLVGRNLVEWLTATSRLHYETSVIPQLLQKKLVGELVIDVRKATGTIHSVMMSANIVTDPETGVHRIFLVLMEAAERIAHAQNLIAAQRIAQIAQDRLRLLQEATSKLAVATGLDDLGTVLSDSAAQATQAAWSCVSLNPGVERTHGFEDTATSQIWGTAPHLSFPLSELVRGDAIAVYRSPAELRAAFPVHADALAAQGVEALIVSPITRTRSPEKNNEILGAIFNGFRRSRTLAADVMETLRALSVHAERVLDHLLLQEQMRHRALHDGLTGLANRALLVERLTKIIAMAPRSKQSCAVMFLDLDGFKHINDQLGHGVGDDVLREVAARLRRACRPTEVICRLGGDEFVIVAEHIDKSVAATIADRVLIALREPMAETVPGFLLTVSIGVALWDPTETRISPTTEELIDYADSVMYAAKRAGKNTALIRSWQPKKP